MVSEPLGFASRQELNMHLLALTAGAALASIAPATAPPGAPPAGAVPAGTYTLEDSFLPATPPSP